jgi:alpha-galactosidase/6-phospho-beta-glucosidase family protein
VLQCHQHHRHQHHHYQYELQGNLAKKHQYHLEEKIHLRYLHLNHLGFLDMCLDRRHLLHQLLEGMVRIKKMIRLFPCHHSSY